MASYQAAVRLIMAAKVFRRVRLARQGAHQSKPEPPVVTHRAVFTRSQPGSAPAAISESSRSVTWRHPDKPDVTWKWTLNLGAAIHPDGRVDVLCQRFTDKEYDGGMMMQVGGRISEIFTGATLHSFGLGLEEQFMCGRRSLITLLGEDGAPHVSPPPR